MFDLQRSRHGEARPKIRDLNGAVRNFHKYAAAAHWMLFDEGSITSLKYMLTCSPARETPTRKDYERVTHGKLIEKYAPSPGWEASVLAGAAASYLIERQKDSPYVTVFIHAESEGHEVEGAGKLKNNDLRVWRRRRKQAGF